MLFNKSSLKFERSVTLVPKFKRYELLVMSGQGFYYFKNANQVNNFATAYTSLIDEIVFHLELLVLKLNTFTSFMTPSVKHNKSKEHVFAESLYDAGHCINSLKLAKNYSCEFHRLNLFVINAIDHILAMCVNFDKKLINDVNQVYQTAIDLRSKFYFIIKHYQKGLTEKDLTLYSTSTLLSLVEQIKNDNA